MRRHINKKKGKGVKSNEKEADEIERLLPRYGEQIDPSDIGGFKDFPLSQKTLIGLQRHDFQVPTDIQRQSIGYALNGQDVLGAAKTGSGKTLAFVIPILERLWSIKWSKYDGLGALIVSPTRELAYQTFEVLRKVGGKHDFSAALLIGGTDVEFEKARISGTNIVICTPGRLLQHLDENPEFDVTNLQILVLDEADRCLDLGFKTQLNAIIESLPPERQTMLFSATQTKSIEQLARLSLRSPVYVSAHEHATHSTPDNLNQSYIVCDHHQKFNFLWSFLLAHRRAKILVFMSNCKQVRFFREAMRKLRPPQPIVALYGNMSQAKRVNVYDEFCKTQQIVMFATDIAARGLDFPKVDWVVQIDCPVDTEDYIHRVGRTARHDNKGQAVIALTPKQVEPMLALLKSRRIPIEEISVPNSRMQDVSSKLMGVLVMEPELKIWAQRAMLSYVKTLHFLKDKRLFDVNSVDLDAYARSLGLAVTPRVRFLNKQQRSKLGSDQTGDAFSGNVEDDDEDVSQLKQEEEDDGQHVIDDLFKVKSRTTAKDYERQQRKEKRMGVKPEADQMTPDTTAPSTSATSSKKSKGALAKKLVKRGIKINKHKKFTKDDDEEDSDALPEDDQMKNVTTNVDDAGGLDLAEAKRMLAAADAADRAEFKERIKDIKRERKRKLKDERDNKLKAWKQRKLARAGDAGDGGQDDHHEPIVQLAGATRGPPDLSWIPDIGSESDDD